MSTSWKYVCIQMSYYKANCTPSIFSIEKSSNNYKRTCCQFDVLIKYKPLQPTSAPKISLILQRKKTETAENGQWKKRKEWKKSFRKEWIWKNLVEFLVLQSRSCCCKSKLNFYVHWFGSGLAVNPVLVKSHIRPMYLVMG